MSTPLCRCRVLYIGSAVPTITKDGLQGIQQPLRDRYVKDKGMDVKGVDSWLSVWSNGILLEHIDGNKSVEKDFYPIQNLHYCAAVRYVQLNTFTMEAQGRFLPLDAPMSQPHANPNNPSHPPIFAAIFRRQTGVKVLECHAFICTSERAANSLVRCCFHSYADTTFMRMNDRRALKDQSRSASPNESEQQASEMEAIPEAPRESDQEWQDRAIDRKTWQWRHKGNEYDDSASMLSSLYVRKAPKKGAKMETQSEVYEHEQAIVPFNGQGRRSGSQTDVRVNGVQPEETYYTFSGGPPGATFVPGGAPNGAQSTPTARRARSTAHYPPPFPPPHFMKGGVPPPHFFGPYPPPPPPPHFFAAMQQRAGSMPPPGLGARFGFMPPPPPMFPFFAPPPPPPHFFRPQSPAAGEGPIVTEALYDTYPRHFDAYGNAAHAYYESYYDTYKSRAAPKRESESETSVDDSQCWESEAGAARPPRRQPNNNNNNNGNGSSNGNSHQRVRSAADKSPAAGRAHAVGGQATSTPVNGRRAPAPDYTPMAARRHHRPMTPPADYERNSVLIDGGAPPARQAAVF